MDRGMQSCVKASQGNLLQLCSLATWSRWSTVRLPFCFLRRGQCRSSQRNIRRSETSLLHQQSFARARAKVPEDRKTSSHPPHSNSKTEAVFLSPHGGSPNGLITLKIHCLNSLIFIYFRAVYCVLHVFWLVFRCVLGNEGVKSKRIKKEVKRATWASNDIMLTSHPIEISKTERSHVQQQKLPKKLRFCPNPLPHFSAQVWGIQLQIEWYKRGSADEKKSVPFFSLVLQFQKKKNGFCTLALI